MAWIQDLTIFHFLDYFFNFLTLQRKSHYILTCTFSLWLILSLSKSSLSSCISWVSRVMSSWTASLCLLSPSNTPSHTRTCSDTLSSSAPLRSSKSCNPHTYVVTQSNTGKIINLTFTIVQRVELMNEKSSGKESNHWREALNHFLFVCCCYFALFSTSALILNSSELIVWNWWQWFWQWFWQHLASS